MKTSKNKSRQLSTRFFPTSILLIVLEIGFAQMPQTMNFQGTLLNPETGVAKEDGDYNIVFRIFDAAESGNELWNETHSTVPVSKGNFSVLLGGAGTPLTLPFDVPYWIELTVESELLAPRLPLVSSPYAFRALTAENIDGNNFDDGNENLFIGSAAGAGVTTGTSNSFFGYQAGTSNNSGGLNTFFGYRSGTDNTSGSSNVFLGADGGNSNTTGLQNTFVGAGAGMSNTEGSNNVAIGRNAGSGNISGNSNVFLGAEAGNMETGSEKLYIENSGSTSPLIYGEFDNDLVRINGNMDVTGTLTGDGSSLTGITVDGDNFDDGNGNLLIGLNAGVSITTGISNIFIGNSAGTANNEGQQNTFIGWQAGSSNTTGINNVFVGSRAGNNSLTASNNTFLGSRTGIANTGSTNTFVGQASGEDNTSGNSNSFFGRNAGNSNTIGNSNTFIGVNAGITNTSGSDNTFIGSSAGSSHSTGTSNIFIGNSSGGSHMNGTQNVFIGVGSGQSNSSGTSNIIVGSSAGLNNQDGINNVFIGDGVGLNNVNGSGNVFLGYSAGTNELGSNKLYIENSVSSTPLLYGEFDTDRVGINRVSSANTLEVGGDASKTSAGDWLANSDFRIKEDIRNIENSLEILKSLRPVKFKYTKEWRDRNPTLGEHYYYNFIAQEYQEIFPQSVKGSGEFVRDDQKELLQIDTYNAQIVTIKAVQELVLEIEQLRRENAELKENNIQISKDMLEMRTLLKALQGQFESRVEEKTQSQDLK